MTPLELRAYRHHRGWSQDELSRALGLNRQAVIEFEAGRRAPTRWLLLALAAVDGGLDPFTCPPAAIEGYRSAGRPKRISKPLKSDEPPENQAT